jgi:hypothetical protein
MKKFFSFLSLFVVGSIIVWNTISIMASKNGNLALAQILRPNSEIVLQSLAIAALPNLGDRRIDLSDDSYAKATFYASKALKRSAWTPGAIGTLAFSAVNRENIVQGRRLTALQPTIGSRDQLLLISILVHSAKQNDIGTGLFALETISRVRKSPDKALFPAILALGAQPETQSQIIDILNRNPLWRERFMISTGEQPANRDAFAKLIDGMIERRAKFRTNELVPFFLVNRNSLPLSDQLRRWQSLFGHTSKLSPVRDADFEKLSGPPPYSWQFSSNVETQVNIVDRPLPAKGRWLSALLTGQDAQYIVGQYITLTQGRWRLSAEMRIVSDDEETVRLVIRCLPDRSIILDSRFDSLSKVTTHQFKFTVENDNCPQQELSFSSEAKTNRAPFEFFLDDVYFEKQI